MTQSDEVWTLDADMRALTIFSGGLDSTVALAMARSEGFDVEAVSFTYGQRHVKEVDAAQKIAGQYGIPLHHLALPAIAGSALTDGPDLPRDRNPRALDEEVAPTYVPNRNMILIAHAAAIAYEREIADLFGGWNVLDASNYPDCRESFLRVMESALREATARTFQIHRPLIAMTKADIVRKGLELGAPLALTWSCYEGSARPCLRCDTCLLRTKGFAEAGTPDPALTPEEWSRAQTAYKRVMRN